jgi:type II secretory pathway component PulF
MQTFSPKEQTLLLKRLAFLMQAHIPIVEALTLITQQTRATRKARKLRAVTEAVSKGKPLAEALYTEHILNTFSLHLIHIGEMSGSLHANLTYLADELYKKQQLRRKVQSALWYPLCISTVTLGITGALITYIFPKLMPIFVSMGTELPLTTRLLIHTAAWLGSWWWALLISSMLGATTFLVLYRYVARMRYVCDWVLVYAPLVGSMTRSFYTATIARTFALLLQSQVPLIESLKTCAYTANNTLYREALTSIATEAAEGKALSPIFARSPKLFPDLFVHLIAVAESSGNMIEALQYLATLYETEVDERSKNISNAVEPALMLVMGAVVGLIAVSVITPIYGITEHLQQK